jgi:predicted transcriptional regulator of viral defense system
VHPQLRAVAERRDGIVTATDALRAGYGHPEIRHLVASGRWIRLRRGVYISAPDLARAQERGRGHRVACLALLLALDRRSAVISHGSAARLWGLPTPREQSAVLRLTDPARWRRGPDYVMTRAPLGPGDAGRSGDIRLTSAARTLIDCAREWPLDDAVVALDAALLAERTTTAQLRSATESARHWPGAARAMRAVELADGRAESPLETRGRLRILGCGLPTPQLQVEIRSGGRLVGVVDAWFEEAAVAVEFDGRIKYTNPWRERSPERVLWEEKRREDELRALDIRVVRVVEDDLGGRWPGTQQRLEELLGRPGPAGRRFTAVPRARGLRRTG